MTKHAELMPCPFCGGRAEILDVTCIEPHWWCASIMCTGIYNHTCSVQMVCGGDTKSEATERVIRAWNTRTAD